MSQAAPYFAASYAEPSSGPLPIARDKGPVTRGQFLFVVAVALGGGLLGILGAFVQEVRAVSGLGPFVVAPIVEEALKPVGIYWLQARWPELLPNRFFTAALAGLSGLTFGYLESLVYLYVYHPHHGAAFVVVRLTITPAMHMVASFIMGLGISRQLIEGAYGRSPFPGASRPYFVAAMAVHGGYNLLVTVLALNGIWKVR